MTLIGKILAGRYEILEEIGNGGMAVVYKAKCQLLNRFVAVKVLRPDLQNDEEFVRRFNVEAQAAASLAHPNIVSIYDVGYEDGLHYIVMEFIEGKTLKEYIEEKNMLSWREAVDYAIQIAKGLEQAHKNSIVHRDIKPHNIIMTTDGVLKVTDFGIARANVQTTVTCEDSAIGSVHYISPEQARGGFTDERSDIYSLAVVMYEMLTGKVPFDSDRPVTVAIMHLQDKPISPREYNISIPLALEKIVMKAMSKEVSARYRTITEMINELQGILSSVVSAGENKTDLNGLHVAPDLEGAVSADSMGSTRKIPEVNTIAEVSEENDALISTDGEGMVSNQNIDAGGMDSAFQIPDMDSLDVPEQKSDEDNLQGIDVMKTMVPEDKDANVDETIDTENNVVFVDNGVNEAIAENIAESVDNKSVMDETVRIKKVDDSSVRGKSVEAVDEVIEEPVEEGETIDLKDKTKKYKVNKKKARLVIILAIVCACILTFSLALFFAEEYGWFTLCSAPVGGPEIPDVVGMQYDDAVEQYETVDEKDIEYRLDFVISGKVKSDKPAGTILSQTPKQGDRVDLNQHIVEIKLEVSIGDDKIKLDDYFKKNKEEAKLSLRNLGLEPDFIETFNEDIPKGLIVRQNPQAGSKVEKGGVVTLYISKGVDEENQGVIVEDYIGESDVDKVKEDIEDQGFRFDVEEKYHDTVPKGEIFDQNPNAGTKMEKGAKVTVYVSKGRGKQDEPDVSDDVDEEVDITPGSFTDGLEAFMNGGGDESESESGEEDFNDNGWNPEVIVAGEDENSDGTSESDEENESEDADTEEIHSYSLTVSGPKDESNAFVEVVVDGHTVYSKAMSQGTEKDINFESENSVVVVEIYHNSELKQRKTLRAN